MSINKEYLPTEYTENQIEHKKRTQNNKWYKIYPIISTAQCVVCLLKIEHEIQGLYLSY
jgi:hypothetical protein